MDKIFIKDLEVHAYHGVLKEEKSLGQRFIISMELFMDLSISGTTDDLNTTVNYAEVCTKVENKFKEKSFDLIEAAAEELCKFILEEYKLIQKVKLTLKKPWAPIGKSLDYVGVEMVRGWHTVYIGIGSNIGDRKLNIDEAINEIKKLSKEGLVKISNMYETKPVGYTEQADFLNCAVEIKTLLTGEELISKLLLIEAKLKRERILRWGPRTIDLDILLYDSEIFSSEKLIVPHPRMQDRLFVLAPLCDLAPYKVHPIIGRRMFELKEILEKTQKDDIKPVSF